MYVSIAKRMNRQCVVHLIIHEKAITCIHMFPTAECNCSVRLKSRIYLVYYSIFKVLFGVRNPLRRRFSITYHQTQYCHNGRNKYSRYTIGTSRLFSLVLSCPGSRPGKRNRCKRLLLHDCCHHGCHGTSISHHSSSSELRQ